METLHNGLAVFWPNFFEEESCPQNQETKENIDYSWVITNSLFNENPMSCSISYLADLKKAREQQNQKIDYFKAITSEHKFQELTESNKPGVAYRKGIYLSEVTEDQKEEGFLTFNLLRCSTNFQGPTDNFRDIDRKIIAQVNAATKKVFPDTATLNHVLAQVYENKIRKAKVAAHSDKTKDMPENAVIAFCTFYNSKGCLDKNWKHGDVSGLTTLQFRLKKGDVNKDLPKDFSVLLTPNSLLVIPLSTNRLYTHEIVPSVLPSNLLPTRLGYVIRSSTTQAIFRAGKTFILNKDAQLIPMHAVTPKDQANIKALYLKENMSLEKIDYGEEMYFSLNDGDYLEPIL
jgi:hypothetical protein